MIMSPALFKIVIAMLFTVRIKVFRRIFRMKQGYEIAGVKFTQSCVFSRVRLAAFRAKVSFLMN